MERAITRRAAHALRPDVARAMRLGDTGGMRSLRTILFASALVPAAIALADDVSVPNCVHGSKRVSHRDHGYMHAVQVRNRCEEPIECTASSDSAPDPVPFRVDAGALHARVLQLRAPGAGFELRLRCEKQ